jgi:iron complex outermembrane recepter protein
MMVRSRGVVYDSIRLAMVLAPVFFALPILAVAQPNAPYPPGDLPTDRATEMPNAVNDTKKLLDLDIEQLGNVPVKTGPMPSMNTEVTSVTREQSTIGQSAAAVFVITSEMIRRSGATTIPDALRMAPGLEVARVNSNSWAISSRGFNSQFANMLLVMIDGRTVYSPVFSGVNWDVQDYVMEDIDRIEVIRGPGGTLWGANAVNGVINIITKNSKDTQGAYVSVGGGTEERFNSNVRLGGRIGEDGYYRVYGKYFDRGSFYNPTTPPNDAWNQGRFGFRTDFNMDSTKCDSLTVQGDHYTGISGDISNLTLTTPPYSQLVAGAADNTGENVLLRWSHVRDEDSDWKLQTYYDQFDRGTLTTTQKVKTFDIDFQYRFPLGKRHGITCGAGYRNIHSLTPSESPFTVGNQPPELTTFVASQFIQDEIALVPDLWALIMGCKLEQNTFTGLEYQPSMRMLYTPDKKHTLWGAVSRAVRTPSEADEDVSATFHLDGDVFLRSLGNNDLMSETLFAYEVGYREQTTDQFAWDIAAFYNVYDHLISYIGTQMLPPVWESDPPPLHLVYPALKTNNAIADTYGVELATTWTVSETWRLYSQYTFLRMLVHRQDSIYTAEGSSPNHQFFISSSWDLRKNMDFDLMARYVDALPSLGVPSYTTMDLRLAYRPRKNLELAIVGQNLLQTYHEEFASFFLPTQVPRGCYGTLTWKY